MTFMFAIVGLLTALTLPASAQSAGNGSKTAAVDSMISSNGEASFRLYIKNDDSRNHKYALTYGLIPKGLQAEFTLDGKIINEVDVKAQDSIIAILKVKTPSQASAGTMVIDAQAKRDDGQIYELPVSVTVNNDYSMVITNRIDGLSIITGQDLSFDISVLNNGGKNLDNIKLSLDLPYKWIMQNTNPGMLSLKPGESGLYKVKISIPPSQVSGNYKIKATAASDSTTSQKVEIPVTVQNNPNYLFWVIGVIAAAGLGTLLYFRKHGRR
jgi:uncharacterized membrane protein